MYLMKESEWLFHAKLANFHFIKTRTHKFSLYQNENALRSIKL